MRLQDIVINEDRGPKIQQLAMACKELGIKHKPLTGPYGTDEMVGRVVAAVNAVNATRKSTGVQGIHALSNAVFMLSKLPLPRHSGYHDLRSLQSLAPDTLVSSSSLDKLISAVAVQSTEMTDVKEICTSAHTMINIIMKIEEIANGTVQGDDANYAASIAKANLKSLGIK